MNTRETDHTSAKQPVELRWQKSQRGIGTYLKENFRGFFKPTVSGHFLDFGGGGSTTSDFYRKITINPQQYEKLIEKKQVVEIELGSIETQSRKKKYEATHALTLLLTTFLRIIADNIQHYHEFQLTQDRSRSVLKVAAAEKFFEVFDILALGVKAISPDLLVELVLLSEAEGYRILMINEVEQQES